jgi:hypothetical protein
MSGSHGGEEDEELDDVEPVTLSECWEAQLLVLDAVTKLASCVEELLRDTGRPVYGGTEISELRAIATLCTIQSNRFANQFRLPRPFVTE